MIAIMIGVIITVRIAVATARLVPSSWITNRTDSRAPSVAKWSATNGTITRIPISP